MRLGAGVSHDGAGEWLAGQGMEFLPLGLGATDHHALQLDEALPINIISNAELGYLNVLADGHPKGAKCS